ncbi:DUF2333 family protein [Halomonas sp.]|uniref:DUF2333 family protein n=1 Tax=Halomonas sp. TaxID=1486246 RepID=UPI003568770F
MAMTGKRVPRRNRRTEALERPDYGWIWKPLLALAVIYLLATLALSTWWSLEPSRFDVEGATAERRGQVAAEPASRGAVTTATLITTVATLLEKPGGYVRNDLAPPGLWLDNMPNWELGVLNQARDLADSLPLMESEAVPALDLVGESLRDDSRDWLMPSTEDRLESALGALDGYLLTLSETGDAEFVAGAGLDAWLDRVAGRLDDLGRRLSSSVASREQLGDLNLNQLPPRTPRLRVDDIFYEARGSGWALVHFFEAVRRDQQDALVDGDVQAQWELLIAELERTQRRLWSPMVLNGSGFGIIANHSQVMANHMMRARDLAREVSERLEAPAPSS